MAITLDGTNGINSSGVIVAPDGSAAAPAITNDADTNTGIFFPAADTIAFAEGGAEAMRINSSGNVGIGTSSPSAEGLTVSKSTSGDAGIKVQNSTGGGLFAQGNSVTVLAGLSTSPLTFYTNAAERARITSGGGFQTPNPGTATDAHRFSVNRPDGVTMSILNANNTSPYGQIITFTAATPNNTTNYFFNCSDPTNTKLTIFSSGTITNRTGTYNSFSDIKLKQDITDASSQWDDIKALRVVKYRLKDEVAADPNYPAYIGLIAQEAEQVSPGIVDDCPDFEEVEVTDEEGNVTTERQATGTVTKAVKYSILYMKAVKALQEAMERIETLEAKVAALEANNV